MEDWKKKQLTDNWAQLVEHIQSKELLGHLFGAKVITFQQKNDIQEQRGMEKLLNILYTGSSASYDAFCRGLQATGQQHIVEKWLTCPPDLGEATAIQEDVREPPSVDQRAEMIQATVKRTQAYPMDEPQLGRALIINNQFMNTNKYRKGSEVDAANLKALLEDMGFMVEVKQNLTKKALEDTLQKFQKPAHHKGCNTGFICIMTHGCREGLECEDDEIIPWEIFTSCLNRVSSLFGKPKLFLIQACRGGCKDEGVGPDSAAAHLPTDTDVFIMYPTVHGKVAWRNFETGSYLVSNLVPVFRENYQRMELQGMYNLVKDRVAEEVVTIDGVRYKQAAEAVDRLRKVFYFTSESRS